MAERSVKVRLSAEIGQFESSMKKAATSAERVAKDTEAAGKAAEKTGQSFKGAVGDVDKFGNALSEADVAAGRYVNGGGRVVEANGKMAAGFGKTREATEKATDSADKATGAWARMADTARENEQEWAAVSTAMLGIGAVAVAGVGLAVKTFADYDKAMSSVRAATHASEKDMEALGEAAVQAGADTAFSAEEAARGIEELAKAGVSTSDILGGGLDGALSLAAAGSLEVGEAAEIAASALVQFKLGGEDVEHVADLLAAGAGKAQGSVQDLGAALGQSGLVAESTGLTIEETTGALSAFASAGLTGSDAGTSFKTMLMSLNPNSEAAATAMEELGISAYDAQGNFVGMSEYAGILQGALSSMSDEQRNATMKTIFGSDAVRAANVLYEQGADGIQKWEDAVNDAGYAAETAALMQDNLAGDIEKLGGALDTVFLQSGSGANDALRGAVQSAEAVVDAIGRIPGPVLTATTAIAGVGGAALITVGGIMKGVSAAAEFKDSLGKLGVDADKTKGKLAKLGKAAGVAGGFATLAYGLAKVAEASYMDDIDDGMGRVALALDRTADAAPGASAALDDLFRDRDGGNLIDGVTDLESAIDRTFNKGAGQKFNDWAEGIIHGMTGIEGSSQILEGSWDRIDQELANLVSSGNADQAAKSFEHLAEMARQQGVGYDELSTKLPGYKDALAGAAAESDDAAAGAESVASGVEGIAAAAEEAAPALDDVVDSLYAMGILQMDARTATANFHESLRGLTGVLDEINEAAADPEIADMGRILNDAGDDFDLASEAGGKVNAAFQDIITSGIDMAKTTAAAGGSFGEINGKLATTYDELIAAAGQLGITGEAADTLVRNLLDIPENVDIDTHMASDALDMALAVGGALEGIPDEKRIRTWMGDAAFQEAMRTKAEALGIPEDVAISSFMDSFAKNEADATTAMILGIPEGASVASWMDANARNEAWLTTEAINAIPREVQIQVNMTPIEDSIKAWEQTRLADMGVIDPRAGVGTVYRPMDLPPRAKGGRVPALADGGRLPSYATGGRLPATGLGTDQILGISSLTGQPTAWVDDREWVVNAPMSDKFNAVIGAMNRDDPSVQHLAGYAAGGRPGVREFAASANFTYSSQSTGPVTVDASGIEAAVARGLANAHVQFTMGNRTIYGIITDAMSAAQRR